MHATTHYFSRWLTGQQVSAVDVAGAPKTVIRTQRGVFDRGAQPPISSGVRAGGVRHGIRATYPFSPHGHFFSGGGASSKPINAFASLYAIHMIRALGRMGRCPPSSGFVSSLGNGILLRMAAASVATFRASSFLPC